MASMIILRSRVDFPEKIEEMKMMYPSKDVAMQRVDNAIDYLRKVKEYRQYTESDDIFQFQVVLHIQLKEYLETVPDWAEVPKVKESIFVRLVTPISTWQNKLFFYLVKFFPKWFSSIQSRVTQKHLELKRKKLI
jgi:hypothetical protein